MAFKLATIFTLVAVAAAVEYSQHDIQYATQPVYKQVVADSPAEYDFAYAVEDPHTGDVKSHQESRKGDVVHGQYSLIDADGHRRIVEYTVDAHSGFKAVVRREPVKGYVAKAPVAYKQVVPQVQHVQVAPQAYVHQAAPQVTQAYVHQAPQQAYVHHAAPQVAQAYVHQPAQVYVQPQAQVQHVAQQAYVHQSAPQVTQAYVQAAPLAYQGHHGGQQGSSVSYSGSGQSYHY